MAYLDSTSTLEEIQAAYFDGISYAERGDATAASSFITAANMLLMHRPKRVRHADSEIEFDSALIERQIKLATSWLARRNGTAGGVRFLGIGGGFR